MVGLQYQNMSLFFRIDSTDVIVNKYFGDPHDRDENVTIDAPATIISGTTYVPLRFVAESFGLDVGFVNGIVVLDNGRTY
jgi:hypothetical protein